MDRRSFLKWLLSMMAVATAGTWSFLRFGQPDRGAQGPAPTASASATPSPSPTPATPSPSPSPTPSPTPQGSGNLLLSFFLLSDLHVSLYEPGTVEKLKLALADVSEFDPKIEAIVLGGDLTDFGTDNEYSLLRKTLNGYKLPPLYGNMGNHDFYDIWINKDGAFSTDTMPNGKTDAMARARFNKFIGYKDKAYADVTINGVHLMMLSQESYVQERADVGEGAWYTDEQLEWFKKTIAPHKDGSPALVFIHQPLPAVGSDGRTHQLIRANAFRDIVRPYPNVFVFSGHTHRNFIGENHYVMHENFHWFNNASVGRTRGAGSLPNPDGSASQGASRQFAQGMFIQVYERQIVVRGREFTTREWIEGSNWTVPLKA
ncbi:MAG: metallophosphoesterase [Paenibacillaceae bacterium]|nr:metallophosphoesterase [Paenibacillaceae bacterium]